MIGDGGGGGFIEEVDASHLSEIQDLKSEIKMTGLRFPKSARLSRASEFQRMRREGQSFHGKFFVLSVLKNLPSPEVRVGFITSRRVGGAVVRNGVRRRLREIVRATRPQIVAGTWLTVVARQAAARATFQSLAAEWRQLAQRSTILGACS